jgi:hypothetical protein
MKCYDDLMSRNDGLLTSSDFPKKMTSSVRISVSYTGIYTPNVFQRRQNKPTKLKIFS